MVKECSSDNKQIKMSPRRRKQETNGQLLLVFIVFQIEFQAAHASLLIN